MPKILKNTPAHLKLWGHWKKPVFHETKAVPLTPQVEAIVPRERKAYTTQETVHGMRINKKIREAHKAITPGLLYRVADEPRVKGGKLIIPVERKGTDYHKIVYAARSPEAVELGKDIPRTKRDKTYFKKLFKEHPYTVATICVLITADNKVVTLRRSSSTVLEANNFDGVAGYARDGQSPVQAITSRIQGELNLKRNEFDFLGPRLLKEKNQEDPRAMVTHVRTRQGCIHTVFVARTKLTSEQLTKKYKHAKDTKYVRELRFTDNTPKGMEELIKENYKLSKKGFDRTIYTELFRLHRKELLAAQRRKKVLKYMRKK
ncbi:MAG: hypothetical protein ABH821_04500 [archaeon]